MNLNLGERSEFWAEHRRLYRVSPQYRVKWHAQHPKGSKPIPPRATNELPRVTLAKFILAHDCEHLPQTWATILGNLANVYSQLGFWTPGTDGDTLLATAATFYRSALEVKTREHAPLDWAMIQSNLAVALTNQAARVERRQARALFEQALEACRQALQVYTREHFTQRWTTIQTGLSNVQNLLILISGVVLKR
jgi:hypothetical protein